MKRLSESSLVCVVLAIALCLSATPCAAQTRDPVMPGKLAEDAAQFSVYEKLSLLELEVEGKSRPGRPAGDRLNDLEKSVFGNESKTPETLVSRIDNLLREAKPSNELVFHLVEESAKTPAWSFRSATAPWTNTDFQIVSMLEVELLGKVSPDTPMIERVKQLQSVVWPGSTLNSADLSTQIQELRSTVNPSQEAWNQAQKQLSDQGFSYASSWSMPWLSTVGSGIKKTGKKIGKYTQPARGVFKSPTFWMVLLAAGAVTGFAIAAQASNNSSEYVNHGENRCTGEKFCTQCKNCRYCHWCNEGGKPCGVHVRLYGF